MTTRSILAAITDRFDRQSRRNALGHDEEPEFIDLEEYLDTLTVEETRPQRAGFLAYIAAAALGFALASLVVGTPAMFGTSLAASMALGIAADLSGVRR